MVSAIMPRTNQAAKDRTPAVSNNCRVANARATRISTRHVATATAINSRECVRVAKPGDKPHAMPKEKAIAMASAGSRIRRAVTEPAFRCERSAGTDRRNPRTEVRNDESQVLHRPACAAFAARLPDRGQALADRRKGRQSP